MQNIKGFTLVELIVVITILAILWTIAFISLQWYAWESRDSKRISDLQQIRVWLQIEQAKKIPIPMPDNAITIWTWSTIYMYQWYAWEWTLNKIRVNEAKDPTNDTYYTYTTNWFRNRFQLVAMLENWDMISRWTDLFTKTYADYENRYAYPIWDPMWTLLDSTTNTPVHQLTNPTAIDLSTDTSKEYIPVFTREDSSEKYSWSILSTKILENHSNYSCESKPNYLNTNFIPWIPMKENQEWQNLDSSQSCYYECTDWYSWEQCNIPPSCGTQPSYENATYSVWIPTQESQIWQDDNNEQACYYECINWYTWEQCEIAPNFCPNWTMSYQTAVDNKEAIRSNMLSQGYRWCEIPDYPWKKAYIVWNSSNWVDISVVSLDQWTEKTWNQADSICNNLWFNWRLPSRSEWSRIYEHRNYHYWSFSDVYYWTSKSSSYNEEAVRQGFYSWGTQLYSPWTSTFWVRCASNL